MSYGRDQKLESDFEKSPMVISPVSGTRRRPAGGHRHPAFPHLHRRRTMCAGSGQHREERGPSSHAGEAGPQDTLIQDLLGLSLEGFLSDIQEKAPWGAAQGGRAVRRPRHGHHGRMADVDQALTHAELTPAELQVIGSDEALENDGRLFNRRNRPNVAYVYERFLKGAPCATVPPPGGRFRGRAVVGPGGEGNRQPLPDARRRRRRDGALRPVRRPGAAVHGQQALADLRGLRRGRTAAVEGGPAFRPCPSCAGRRAEGVPHGGGRRPLHAPRRHARCPGGSGGLPAPDVRPSYADRGGTS